MNQRGFTLIEGVITIVIAGLLIAAALPNASDWIRNSRIRAAADSMQIGLQQARNEAVRRNTTVTFWLVTDPDPTALTNGCKVSSTGSAWVVSVVSPEDGCASEPSTTTAPMIVAKQPSGNGGSGLSVSALDSTGTAATQVTFNGFGQVTGATSISCIKVANTTTTGSRPLRVAISSAGQVRACDPAVTGSDPRVCLPGCDSST